VGTAISEVHQVYYYSGSIVKIETIISIDLDKRWNARWIIEDEQMYGGIESVMPPCFENEVYQIIRETPIALGSMQL
jgi:hypothetical protein